MVTEPVEAEEDSLALSRQTLVDRIWVGAGVLAVLQLPLIAWRAGDVGLHGQLIVHLALSLMAMVVCLARRRMAHTVKSALLVGGMLAIGLSSLFSLGMGSGAGYFWTLLGIGLTALLHSVRLGVAIAVIFAALQVWIGLGFISHRFELPFDLNAHAVSASAWANFIVVTGFVSLVMLFAAGGFQGSMVQLLTRLKAQRDELRRMAAHDPLTGLPTVQLGADRLDMAIHAARRSGGKVCLLFIDLDGFKAVNDSLGHDVGDVVLKEVARRLPADVRASDTVARAGGDEFIVILGGVADVGQTTEVARKIIESVSRPIEIKDTRVSVGASIGVALFPDHAADAAGLRRAADAAMYQAKRCGKNRFCVAEAERPAGDTAN